MKKYLTIIAFALGLISAWVSLNLIDQTASVISDVFLRLLKLISLPIIFLSIGSTITGMQNFQEMRSLGRRVLFYTLATTLIAASIALALFLIVKPASGVNILASTEVIQHKGSYLQFALETIPSNFFMAFAENNVIGVAFIAFLLSICALGLPEKEKNFVNQIFSTLFSLILKVTQGIIRFMPLAIWAFVTLLGKELRQNYTHFHQLMLFLGCVVGANLIQGFVILPLLLKWKGLSTQRVFKGMSRALAVAFFTKSSSAALPITLESCQKNLNVSSRVSQFSLPLCSVINMNGCAAFILLAVLFVSMVNGVAFSGFEFVGWIFLATLAAIGNAGVPMGCYFLASAFLVGMKVPLHVMGLILPFYTILDMIETALNVWSDGCITVVVDKECQTLQEA